VAAAITDWCCRFVGIRTTYIERGSPWQNPFVESFNVKARDELFARDIFDSVFEARVLTIASGRTVRSAVWRPRSSRPRSSIRNPH
jgi:hypothetical protein